MTDEYLMWSLVAADRHARPAPQCLSYSISCRYIPQSPAVLIHVAMVASFSSSLVQGVERLVLGSQEVARVRVVLPETVPLFSTN